MLLCDLSTTNFKDPVPFSVDISGVTDLKIEMSSDSIHWYDLMTPEIKATPVISKGELIPAP